MYVCIFPGLKQTKNAFMAGARAYSTHLYPFCGTYIAPSASRRKQSEERRGKEGRKREEENAQKPLIP